MSVQEQRSNQRADPYLSPNQQDLLLRALESQSKDCQVSSIGSDHEVAAGQSHSSLVDATPSMSVATNDGLFMSPQNAELDSSYLDYTPDIDYLDGGDNFDFENADLGGDMIGALPGSGSQDDVTTTNGDGHEKRKSRDESNESEGGDAKRQETQEGEKGAKKPGRKPLTSEPTTKRKAQNRAAQRAFRERKEKHLKDLETQVSELTKASEADKHENGLLKAQVERLQVELREYRKRLSLNSGASRSPPLSTSARGQQRSSGSSYGGGFQFEFPKFGALPGSQIFGNGNNSGVLKRDSLTPPISQSPTAIGGYNQQSQQPDSRQNSTGRSMSPQSKSNSNAASPAQYANVGSTFAPYSTNNNMHGFASTLPQMTSSSDPFGDLFSPSILKGTDMNEYFKDAQTAPGSVSGGSKSVADNGGDSTSGLNRVFQFNGGSNVSDTTSPSASTSSQWNANGTSNSSCGTSPEPSHDSPANNQKHLDSFSDKAAYQNQSDRANNKSVNSGFGTAFGFDNADYSAPSMGNFDPVLFGDYRESNDAIVGGGDFSGGFFDEALNSASFDYGSPSNLFGILQSPQQTQTSLNMDSGARATSTTAPSKALMAEMEKARDGGDDDYGLSNTQPQKSDQSSLVSCNNIWQQLQSNPEFQEGKFDLDNLCSELRAKAKCSESGVMVDQNHVNAALKKLGKKDSNGKPIDVPPLMFEKSSWENVLKKLQNGST